MIDFKGVWPRPKLKTKGHHFLFGNWSSVQDNSTISAILYTIIKFPYNAHSDWLKKRTLSEYKGQVNDIKLAFKFLLRNFDKFDLN